MGLDRNVTTTSSWNPETQPVDDPAQRGPGQEGDEYTQREVAGKFAHVQGFNLKLLWCLIVASIPCAVVSCLLSTMGIGREVYEFLGKYEGLYAVFAGSLAGIMFVLYMLDYFMPPHMPGQYCKFRDTDTVSRGIFMFTALSLLYGTGLLAAKDSPTVPITMSMLHGPVFLLVLRHIIAPKKGLDHIFQNADLHGQRCIASNVAKHGALMQAFKTSGNERRDFYRAAMMAFLISGIAQTVVWLVWAAGHKGDVTFANIPGEGISANQYLLWIAPFAVGVGNMFVAAMLCLRVWMADAYEGTFLHYVSTSPEMKSDQQSAHSTGRQQRLTQDLTRRSSAPLIEWRKNLTRSGTAKQLELLTKAVGCFFFSMMAIIYAGSQLLAAESHLADLVLSLLWVLLADFTLLLVFSFWSLMKVLKDDMFELPMWKMAKSVAQNEWARASLLTASLPVLPGILLLSAMNQVVRKRRGLYARIPPVATSLIEHELKKDAGEDILVPPLPGDQLLTARIGERVQDMRRWNWTSIVEKMYIVGFLFACYTLTTRILNIFLAWLIAALDALSFHVVIAATFVCGLCCFLLPPVPGVPVYLFAGLVLATKHDEFYVGCTVAVVTGFVLKLAACGIQQTIIGGILGQSLWIKSQVGVHKPLIRAIEKILSKPGCSCGKVAIACGGPDWPTSVLAGLLRLRLIDMEMATLPIVVFVTPCTLSGSFYLKANDSETWSRWASLMLQFSVTLALFMQITAAWAIQDALDKHHVEVTKPIFENLDLDWLDYRSAEMKKCCQVEWSSIPKCIQVLFVLGMVLEVLWAQVFYGLVALCFGNFAVTDDISTLKLYGGDDGLVKLPGLVGMACLMVAWLGYLIEQKYLERRCRQVRAETMQKLQGREAAWKLHRKSLARLAERLIREEKVKAQQENPPRDTAHEQGWPPRPHRREIPDCE